MDKDEGIRTESGVINDDYLFMGSDLHFSGEAEDLYFLGKSLTFTGKTKLGVFAACQKLIASGRAGNGIMAAGGDIVVDGAVASSSFIGCKSFTLSDVGAMNGDLFAGCATLTMNGRLTGDLHAAAGKIVINNVINGNVTAYGGRILFGEKGKINGNLRYSTKETLGEADLKKVTGAVTLDKNVRWDSFDKFKKSPFGFFFGFGLFLSYIVIASLLLLVPAFGKLDGRQPAKEFWRTALWGLIPVLMYPAAVLVCFILVITIPLAVMLLLAAAPIFFTATVIGTTLIGKFLAATFGWKTERRHLHFLIGVPAGIILSIIPFVNFLVFIFTSALGWGVYLSFLFRKDLAHE
jgi:cytoskeletal protein CcmA (bactofilin family)